MRRKANYQKMNKSFSEKHPIKKFDEIVLMCNGCFSLVLAVTIFLTNILLVMATRRNPLRFNKVIDKINIASFYLNLLACVFFLPCFGITVILQSLQVTKTTVLFASNPSYLSVTVLLFTQSNVDAALLRTIERSSAFIFPHFHRRFMTKNRVLITLLLSESCALTFVCLQLTGINKIVFYTAYIHMFISAPMFVMFILVSITYWNIKTNNRVMNRETPQSAEKLELHRKRASRTARKYLILVLLLTVPMFLCILPWYILTIIYVTYKDSVKTDAAFLAEQFSISFLFLPDLFLPIIKTLRFKEYYNSIKRYRR